MAKSILQNACYIIIFTLCVDRGDGHWKENDRENLRRDIQFYKKMAEKIEREIEALYDEYPEEQLGDNVDIINNRHRANTFHRLHETDDSVETKKIGDNRVVPVTNSINVTSKLDEELGKSFEKNASTIATNETKWPKFEEILLAMGKKYDWKNDRWIKVKEKIKSINEKNKNNNRSNDNKISIVHEKHKFYYKFVKLNRSKNRRSVVVAVSAVR